MRGTDIENGNGDRCEIVPQVVFVSTLSLISRAGIWENGCVSDPIR